MKLRAIRKRKQCMVFCRKRYFFGIRAVKDAQRAKNMQFSKFIDLIGEKT
jgi:hypothetical protein